MEHDHTYIISTNDLVAPICQSIKCRLEEMHSFWMSNSRVAINDAVYSQYLKLKIEFCSQNFAMSLVLQIVMISICHSIQTMLEEVRCF
jgi:hypothetical protein